MNAQIPLALRWPAQQCFAGFAPGRNAAAVELLRKAAREPLLPGIYLHGPTGSGRSHLLLASCAEADARGRSAQYLSLRRHGVEALRGIGGSDLLALDDLEQVAGRAEFERALFGLYNRCRAEGTGLLLAASLPPTQLGVGLPDLVSRLAACTQLALKPLDQPARRELLRERARARGLALDDGVLDWLFVHGRRDLPSLMMALERIDRAALAARRRITLPFVRALFADDAEVGS